ncbi:MAG: NAD(P)/FAD-dependent oxidoreductase [Bacteroidetes bacterium]|nr:NAD(P)/FAD-dependent oxidoreductase [Bacteroidota bacterium]
MGKRLIVIGGGAAGIFCAVNAARRAPGLNVLVLEKTGKLLSKVKVSGGGRCNVTHACFDIGEMAKRYPRGGHFVRKAFHRWFTTDTIEWFRERGVMLKAEEDGRMFPVSDDSQTIIDCLMKEVNGYGVEIRMHAEVVEVATGEGGFRLGLKDGRMLEADYVVVACGGYPKPEMFEWIRKLGHSVEQPVPSLFTFNMPGDPITRLMGVSVPEAQVKIVGTKLLEKGPLLITHWGMSGPVVLRLSAWGARDLSAGGYKFQIRVNWIPEYTEHSARERMQEMRYERAGQMVGGKNPFGLPQRLWEYILSVAGIGEGVRWADLPSKEQNKLVSLLCAGDFAVAGKTTFKEEFVTAGGVRLSEVDPSSFQSRKAPGLFFAGETLDVDGITGGFNFQHAWTSGWVAADTVVGLVSQ